MPLLQVVVILIVVGVLLGLVNRYIPMAGSIKSILNGVVVIGVVLVAPECFWTYALALGVPCGEIILAQRVWCVVPARGSPAWVAN